MQIPVSAVNKPSNSGKILKMDQDACRHNNILTACILITTSCFWFMTSIDEVRTPRSGLERERFVSIMYLFSQYYPIVFTISNALFHFKVPYPSNIIINSFSLISGTYLALIKTAWPTIDWPNGMLLSSSLLDNSVKLMVRSSFARGRILRLQQVFLVLSRPPPL